MQKLDYPRVGETLYLDTLPNGLSLAVAVKPGYTRSYAAFTTNYGGADRRFRCGTLSPRTSSTTTCASCCAS